MYYVIERIRQKNGQPHEREARRKGHRVQLVELTLGSPLILTYPDDGNKVLQTSAVEAFNVNDDGSLRERVVIQTRNSVYVLQKLKEAA